MNHLDNVSAAIPKEVEFWRDLRMPYVETRRACHSRICYQPHSHPTYSIGAVDQGQSRFNSHHADAQLIQAGDLVSIPAQVQHSCNPLPHQTWSYQMMHLNAAWLAELMTETALDLQLTQLPQFQPYILRDPYVYAAFTSLNQCLFDPMLPIFETEQRLIEVLTQILVPTLQWQQLDNRPVQQQHILYLVDLIQTSTQQILSLQQLSQHFSRS